jgi:hypothetical protein
MGVTPTKGAAIPLYRPPKRPSYLTVLTTQSHMPVYIACWPETLEKSYFGFEIKSVADGSRVSKTYGPCSSLSMIKYFKTAECLIFSFEQIGLKGYNLIILSPYFHS